MTVAVHAQPRDAVMLMQCSALSSTLCAALEQAQTASIAADHDIRCLRSDF